MELSRLHQCSDCWLLVITQDLKLAIADHVDTHFLKIDEPEEGVYTIIVDCPLFAVDRSYGQPDLLDQFP